MTSGVYTIRISTPMSPRGEWVYVGSSYRIERRWTQHLRDLKANKHCNPIMQAAYNAHGLAAVSFCIIEECPLEDLARIETHWIDVLDAHSSRGGMNIERVGRSASEATRARLANASSGPLSSEHCAAISRGRRGMKFSESHCKAMAKAKKGVGIRPRSREGRANSSEALKRWHQEVGHTESVKARISASVRLFQAENVSNKWGVKGLTYTPRAKKNPWIVRGKEDGKMKWLGSFPTKETATAFIRGRAQ